MSSAENLQVINILLVEDNPGDIRLTKEVLKEGKIRNTLSVITDGEEALLFLKKTILPLLMNNLFGHTLSIHS